MIGWFNALNSLSMMPGMFYMI